ncbi:MAG TPA: hypothetical protein VNM14_06125, partial [Planctomycetota bacterium]|nr:hypothetical protein [Planctomycetota bacterium]
LRPEVKEDLNRRFAGLGDDLERPYPRVFAEVLWLTRDRAIFDELLRDCDRDAPAGPFTVVNHGVSPASDDQVERSEVIKSWADLAFRLEVGEIGFISPEPGEFPAFAVFRRIR